MGRTWTVKRFLLLCAALALAFALRKCLAAAGTLLLVAGGTACLLCPLCRFLEKAMPRPAAAFLSLLCMALPLVGGLFLVVPVVAERGSRLIRSLSASPLLLSLTEKTRLAAQLRDALASRLDELGSMAIRLVSDTASTLALIASAAMIAYYLLADRDALLLRMELALPSKYREKSLRAVAAMRQELWLYLRGQGIIALCVGTLSALALAIIGVPGGVGLGLLAGGLNAVPYLGPLVACVPVGLSAAGVSLPCAAMAVAALVAVQQIDGLVLSPRIMGASTGFSPAVVLLALFVSGTVWGLVGMVLVLPCLIVLRSVARVFAETVRN